MPHFIDLDAIDPLQLQHIITHARDIKKRLTSGESYSPLLGKHLAMIFEKPSTRTRTSFEVGIHQLGGHAIFLNTENSQLGRGEPISDTAEVLSRYVDFVMIRCHSHDTLLELAKHSSVPVINGLTDKSHPCQVMADVMTWQEHRGSIQGKKVAWFGDVNNMTYSWIHAAKAFDFSLYIAAPHAFIPQGTNNTEHVTWTSNAEEAAFDADVITTDTWFSMGDTDTSEKRQLLAPFQVNTHIMQRAAKEALFLHCLPAHRGDEVTAEVIDGTQSVIFDEAENRLHIQKAIMIWCLKLAP